MPTEHLIHLSSNFLEWTECLPEGYRPLLKELNDARSLLKSAYTHVEALIGFDEGQPKHIRDHATFVPIYKPLANIFRKASTSSEATGKIVWIAKRRHELKAEEKEAKVAEAKASLKSKRAQDDVEPAKEDPQPKSKRSKNTRTVTNTVPVAGPSTPVRRTPRSLKPRTRSS